MYQNFQRLIFCITAALAVSIGGSLRAQLTKTFTQPFEISDVAAAETGVIAEIKVREGDTVSKGDVLGVLNNEVLLEAEKLAHLRAASTARIESTESLMNLRKSKQENLDSLIEKGHANPFEIEQAKSQFEAALADYRLALQESQESKIELAKIQAQIAQRTIRSPIDGVVAKLHKHLGEYVASNDPVFATVVNLSKLKANFYLNSNSIGQLRKGQQVNVVVGEKEVPMRGDIIYLSPIIDPNTGTGRVEIEFDNHDGGLLSGVFCQLISAKTQTGTQGFSQQTSTHRNRSESSLSTSLLPHRTFYR